MVIVKSGRRICGTGAALGNAPIVQNKGYFEVKIQSTGKVICQALLLDKDKQVQDREPDKESSLSTIDCEPNLLTV